MKQVIAAIFDSKAVNFSHVQLFTRIEEAIRSFSIAANSQSHDFYKYAEDYSLFKLGMFDSESGVITPDPVPTMIISAIQASTAHKDHYLIGTTLQSPSDTSNIN